MCIAVLVKYVLIVTTLIIYQRLCVLEVVLVALLHRNSVASSHEPVSL